MSRRGVPSCRRACGGHPTSKGRRMATAIQVQWPVNIEGHLVKPGPGVTALRTEDGQFVVEYADRRFDSIEAVIESGALIEVEPGTSR